MTQLTQQASGGIKTSNVLYNVIELILDRGLVIDVFARVSLVGIEVLTVDARIVVASVDTYLRFAELCNRMDISGTQPVGLPQMLADIGQKAGPR